MGAKLLSYFQEAERVAGVIGAMKLANLTTLTTVYAGSVSDTPELVARFEAALARIKAETAPGEVRALKPAGDAESLRKHIKVFLDVMSQRSLTLGKVTETVRRVDEAAVDALRIARVSVWFLDDARKKITCMDLFERETGKHSSGVELFRKDFPPYFTALETERTIAAHDAHTDPRTSCFSAVYLKPLGIGAMLDVPIWASGKMIGVICHEHLGEQRTWSSDEERFANLMASFVSLAVERATPGR